MLVLTRKVDESVVLLTDDNIEHAIVVKFLSVRLGNGHAIKVGIDAPKSIKVYREEIIKHLEIDEDDKRALMRKINNE